jgi:uncharacterized membrane protein (DUF2068 family)
MERSSLSERVSGKSQCEERRRSPSRTGRALVLIGIYKLLECLLLVFAGFVQLKLIHQDLASSLHHWVQAVRVDPDNGLVHALLLKVSSLSPKQLEELSAGTFLYAGLRLAEGIGLVLQRLWGQYLTVIVTALFIPLEIYELFRHWRVVKLIVLILNIAVVVYLIREIRKQDPRSFGHEQ